MAKWNVACRVSGGVTGTREGLMKSGGKVIEFETREAAAAAAAHTREQMNGPHAKAFFEYWPVPAGTVADGPAR